MVDMQSLFEEIYETREGFRTACPSCNHPGKTLAWNAEKNVGCCFADDCEWAVRKGGVGAKELQDFLGNPQVYTKILKSTKEGDPKLPEEFELLQDLRPGLKEAVTGYLRGPRGLRRKYLEKYSVGYCSTGKFWGYIIFPVTIDGEVVYWQARRFKKRDPKFYNPPSTRKTEWLFRMGPREARHAVIVESVINGLTLLDARNGWTVYVLLGKSLSDRQFRELRSTNRVTKKIVLALDDDAEKFARNIARRLDPVFESVRVASFPEEEDINSLGCGESWRRIYAANRYTTKRHFGDAKDPYL